MLRKALTVSIAAVFLTSSALIVSPANAYNKKIVNGVSCTKLGASIKGKGNESYKCAKNPYYKKTTKTWTWIECINAQKNYLKFKSEHDSLVAAGASASDITSDQDFLDGWLDATKDACKKGA